MQGVTIFGATGPTGELVSQSLAGSGVPVAAVMRSTDRQAEYESFGCTVRIADAMQPDTLIPVLEQTQNKFPTLVNLIGGNPFADPATWPDRDGVINVTNAAVAAGYRTCILVTSVGTGSSWQFVPESSAYIKPIIQLKTEAEAHLKASGLDWCILKPGGLGPPDYRIRRGDPLITENHGVRGLIDREDLAEVILRILRADPATVRHRELYAVADKIEHHAGDPAQFPI